MKVKMINDYLYIDYELSIEEAAIYFIKNNLIEKKINYKEILDIEINLIKDKIEFNINTQTEIIQVISKDKKDLDEIINKLKCKSNLKLNIILGEKQDERV